MPETQRYRIESPAAGAKPPFTQQITLELNGKTIGRARWFAPDSSDGVMQILDLSIDPLHQRQGHGSALLKQVYDQALAFFRAADLKPRRVWVTIEQKRQVIGRAFFSRHGYHHVATIDNVYIKQSGLIYQRSFD